MRPPVDQVLHEHAGFVARVLSHLGVPKAELGDASQEVFVVVLRQYDAFEGRSSVPTWLYGICRNVALGFRRKARGARETTGEDLPETIVQPAQEGELWIRRAHQLLTEVLDELDEAQRMTFVLFEIEELSMQDIATSLGVPLQTCYSRLRAARETLQARLRRRERSRVPDKREVTK